MLFSVSIRDGSGKEIISEVLCGDQLDTLKRDGIAGMFLDQPIIIGTYPAGTVDASRRYAERDVEYDNWSVTVHLFRLDQNKCCCVHDAGSSEWMVSLIHRPPISVGAVDRFVLSCESSSTSSGTLELDERGELLEGRIQEFQELDAPRLRGIQFDVRLNCFVEEQAPLHQDDPSARTVVLELGFVQLEVLRKYVGWNYEGFTDADAHLHGVTLPHLLEHLEKLGDPDD